MTEIVLSSDWALNFTRCRGR